MANNTITLVFENETFTDIKSISAAWNCVRKIRELNKVEVLDGKMILVNLPEGMATDRIPGIILLKANKNGKIEFKDYAKVQAREAKKDEVKDEDMPDQGEDFLNKDLALSML